MLCKKLSIWRGVFKDEFEAQCELIKMEKTKDDFDTEIWLNRQKSFLETASKGKYPRQTHLPFLVHALKSGSIIDFGGGSGWVKCLLPENIRYINIELPQTLDNLAEVMKMQEIEAYTFENIPNINQLDILYSNSVIQYEDTLDKFLVIAKRLKPKLILLDDIQLSSGKSFYSLQRYYNSYLISKFYELAEIVKIFDNNGYEYSYKSNYRTLISRNMKAKVSGRKICDPDRERPATMIFLQM